MRHTGKFVIDTTPDDPAEDCAGGERPTDGTDRVRHLLERGSTRPVACLSWASCPNKTTNLAPLRREARGAKREARKIRPVRDAGAKTESCGS